MKLNMLYEFWTVRKGAPYLDPKSKVKKFSDDGIFVDEQDEKDVKSGKRKAGLKMKNEDQYKWSSRHHSLRQAPYRSSFGKAKTFGGIEEAKKNKKVGAIGQVNSFSGSKEDQHITGGRLKIAGEYKEGNKPIRM